MAANLKDYVLTDCDGIEVIYSMLPDYVEKWIYFVHLMKFAIIIRSLVSQISFFLVFFFNVY